VTAEIYKLLVDAHNVLLWVKVVELTIIEFSMIAIKKNQHQSKDYYYLTVTTKIFNGRQGYKSPCTPSFALASKL